MLPTLPNLDGLIGLARQDGVDVRPTLVRVLTDLYVQKKTHTREEEHRYTELSLSLLAGVDVATRAAVAKKLATYPQAPPLVIRRLARDVGEVAEPILKFSPLLTSDDLFAILKEFGPEHATAIGARNLSGATGSGQPVAGEPVANEPQAAAAEDEEDSAHPTAAAPETQTPDAIAPAEPDRAAAAKSEPLALGDYFLNAASPERRLLLANLDETAQGSSSQPLETAAKDAIHALETAALQRRPDVFVRELQQALRIPAHRARQIVHDDAGEPIAVAAKALAMPSDVLLRILLFLNPVIGQSVERVFSLVDLYDQLSIQAALHLVASWRSAHGAERPTAVYRPLHWDDERRSARRTFAEHGRRFPLQVPDDRRLPTREGERAVAGPVPRFRSS